MERAETEVVKRAETEVIVCYVADETRESFSRVVKRRGEKKSSYNREIKVLPGSPKEIVTKVEIFDSDDPS